MVMKQTWKEMQDGSWTLDLGVVVVKVFWDKEVPRGTPLGWRYQFGKFRSKWPVKTAGEAKQEAYDVVKGKLLEALEMMGF